MFETAVDEHGGAMALAVLERAKFDSMVLTSRAFRDVAVKHKGVVDAPVLVTSGCGSG